MATKPQRAAIYCRISDDREGQALGVARQEEDCRALAGRLGWNLHTTRPVYTDNDRGASTLSRKRRPEYEALMAAVQAGQVDGILYYSTSRLTRRPLENEHVIKLVEETGVRLAAANLGHVDLTTAEGRRMARYLAANDAAEAEIISERVARQQQQRREQGRPHSTGSRPFGFRSDGITPDPAEADAIRDAAKLVSEGATLGDVVRYWTEAAVLPVTRGRWSRTTVRRALTRPRVAGLIEHHGVIVGTIKGCEPILSREVWDDVREKIIDRSGLVRARFHGREHLLAGLVTCGACGGPMKISARRDQDGAVRADSFVSCIKENGGCGHVKRNLRLLDAYVMAAVESRLAEVAPFAEADPDNPAAQERARLTADRDTIDAKIKGLREQYETDPDLDAEDYVLAVKRLRNRARELDAALDALPATDDRRDLGDDPLTEWQAGGFDERRELLEALIETVVLSPIGKVGPTRSRQLVPETTTIVWR